MSEKVAYHFRIYGIVQGVAFRHSASRTARDLNVSGWIKNVEDGSVEGVVEGDKRAVESFVNWCHKGPPLARVDRVVLKSVPLSGFDGFEIRY